uniref:U14-Hexatoxin-Hf1g_1 n=2 Tax=Hadronyche formidabilis TaxID=426499 RepID=A0A4Q8K1A7_HADFO
MKLLHSFVVITVLVAVAVALPSKTKEEIVAERDQLVEDLVQYQEEAPLRKRAEQCSKKLGEQCDYHCECCGATVACDTVYVGDKPYSRCSDKNCDNGALKHSRKRNKCRSKWFQCVPVLGLTEK